MATPVLPRVAIAYCTQCKWGLRAAYYAQELLSTFGNTIGEVALIPATGGLFTVHLTYATGETESDGKSKPEEVLIWDRKAESGFPETKILKQKIRNYIDPNKGLGHSDTPSSKAGSSARLTTSEPTESGSTQPSVKVPEKCEDCP
jgi:selT/selW/selH-like putative selenoprotein